MTLRNIVAIVLIVFGVGALISGSALWGVILIVVGLVVGSSGRL